MDNTSKINLATKEASAKNDIVINTIKSEGKSNQEYIKSLIKGLSDKNGLVRRNYAEELGNIGKAALPELINVLLNSKNVIQRRAAAKTLKLVKDPTALPHLIQSLTHDSDPVVQFSAAGAIAIFGENAVNHLVIVLENQENTEIQLGLASWCLAFIGGNAPKAIKQAAKSKNINVKSAAISALEEIIRHSQDQEAIQLVKHAINDRSENVQVEAIKLVGKLYRIESFIPILILKLKHESQEIRQASILSLMQLNIKEAISPLKELLEAEKNKHLKKIIKLAINKLTTKRP